MEAVRKEKSRLKSRSVAARAHAGREFVLWSDKISKTNPGQRINMIRVGVDASMFVRASEYYEMPRAKLAKIIGMSSATADRKIKAGGKLGPSESERLARIALIEAEAEQVFGSSESAKRWLLSSNLTFGESPLSLLDTDAGAGEVRKALSAIAYGGVA